MTGFRIPLLLAGCLLAQAGLTAPAHHTALEAFLRTTEVPRMQRLAALQSRLPVPIVPFASDGCSGGLSAGWSELARTIPDLAARLGPRPPWEACCVVHDRVYWHGLGAGGYQRRLTADRALRQCVLDTAAAHRENWARRLAIAPARLDDLMRGVAEAMFLAVRVGGGPCTGLPWRWGYGWPPCNSELGFQQTQLGRNRENRWRGDTPLPRPVSGTADGWANRFSR